MWAMAVQDGPDGGTMRLERIPTPEPGPGELLIRVAAAGVNRADVLQRRGLYPPPPGVSPVLGLEVAGTVAATGSGVAAWQTGDRVMALLAGGGYAQYAVVPEALVCPLPSGMDMVSAAALPEAAATVYLNLILEAGLGSGETLLVHGGASGIGTMAIQVARSLRDARVLVTVGSDAKAAACRGLGAEAAIVYRRENFVDRVRSLTAGRGVDLILDHVGAPYLAGNLDALSVAGRLVVIGLLGGSRAELDLGKVLLRRIRIIGSVLRSRSVADKGRIVAGLRRDLLPLLDRGLIRPVIHRALPLAEAGVAHGILEAGENIGKVVLTLEDDSGDASDRVEGAAGGRVAP